MVFVKFMAKFYIKELTCPITHFDNSQIILLFIKGLYNTTISIENSKQKIIHTLIFTIDLTHQRFFLKFSMIKQKKNSSETWNFWQIYTIFSLQKSRKILKSEQNNWLIKLVKRSRLNFVAIMFSDMFSVLEQNNIDFIK